MLLPVVFGKGIVLDSAVPEAIELHVVTKNCCIYACGKKRRSVSLMWESCATVFAVVIGCAAGPANACSATLHHLRCK